MMQMIFFSSTSTPLYSSDWTPRTTSDYAGTCIFLMSLAALFRALFAVKHAMEKKWYDRAARRRYIVIAGKPPEAQRTREDVDANSGTLLTKMGLEEDVRIVRRNVREVQPWRLSVDLPRAGLVTTMTGIGYLLYVVKTILSLNMC